MATDLRASASLVLAGLARRGDDRGAARLPPRPRLRADRGEARAARRAHPAGRRRDDPATETHHRRGPEGPAARGGVRRCSSGRSASRRRSCSTARASSPPTRPRRGCASSRSAPPTWRATSSTAPPQVGIVGLDVLREEPRDLYEPLDLGIGRCRVIVARPRGREAAAAAGSPRASRRSTSRSRRATSRRRASRRRSSRCTARSRSPPRSASPTRSWTSPRRARRSRRTGS